jgi:hypothetical protein
MAELTENDLQEGKKLVGGPKIYFWVLSIIVGLGVLSANYSNWAQGFALGPVSIGLPDRNVFWVPLGLFVSALIGLYIRKGWAIPVGRAGLVVSMVIFFPVGTIFGAILWKRYNNTLTKKYLNNAAMDEKKADEETGTTIATIEEKVEETIEKIDNIEKIDEK